MKFGSSKPVSGQELEQARACLKLLKKRMAVDPPSYFGAPPPSYSSEPASSGNAGGNYRKVFKPESKPPMPNQLAAPAVIPAQAPRKKPNNVAIESSKGFSKYDFEGVDGVNPNDQDERIECPDCGRKFLPESYDKHVNICKKVFVQKRKQFNSAEQRELDEAPIVSTKKKPEPKKAAAKPGGKGDNKWKMQSEQFRANMRAARLAGTGNEAAYQEALKVASDYDQKTLTRCPHCDRTFNDEAAKRHIPICEKKAKINQMKNVPSKPANKRK
jgi:uncharacterized C2H2 Zn-finger protein